MTTLHLHLVSDSTGETVSLVGRASLAQFDDIEATEHAWSMIRNETQVKEVLTGIEKVTAFPQEYQTWESCRRFSGQRL